MGAKPHHVRILPQIFCHFNRPGQLGQNKTESHHRVGALWESFLSLVEVLASEENVKC